MARLDHLTRRGTIIVAGMAALYAAVFFFFCAVKYRYYLYNDFDLAIFVQALDGLLHGSMYSSIRGMNWLGDHSSLILFLIVPLYAGFPHPLTLLLLQSVVLALGALPVYWMARRQLASSFLAVAFAALYLLYPALGYTNLFEFHPEVLCTTTLLFTLHYLHEGRWGRTLLFGFLSLLGKEDVALVVIAMGLYSLTLKRPRRWIYATPLVVLGIASLVLSFGVLKPLLAGREAEYATMYRHWGRTIGEVVASLLKHPIEAMGALFGTPGDPGDTAIKRFYHLHMLLPLLFLPLLAPLLMVVALPVLGEHFLSWRVLQHQIVYQYAALVTPCYLMAAIVGLRNFLGWNAGRRDMTLEVLRPRSSTRRIACVIAALALGASIVSNLAFGPLLGRGWLGAQPARERIWPTAYDRSLAPHRDRIVSEIPKDGAVIAGFEYLARLAARDSLDSLHHVLLGTYTFSEKSYPVPGGAETAVLDAVSGYFGTGSAGRLREFSSRNRLRPVEARGDLLFLAKDRPDSVELVTTGAVAVESLRSIVYDGQLAFLGSEFVDSTAAPGELLTVRTLWRRIAPADRIFLTQYVLLDPRGRVVPYTPRYLGYMFHPVEDWPLEVRVRETYRLILLDDLGPGTYRLGLRVSWLTEKGTRLSESDDPTLPSHGMTIDLGPFEVLPNRNRVH